MAESTNAVHRRTGNWYATYQRSVVESTSKSWTEPLPSAKLETNSAVMEDGNVDADDVFVETTHFGGASNNGSYQSQYSLPNGGGFGNTFDDWNGEKQISITTTTRSPFSSAVEGGQKDGPSVRISRPLSIDWSDVYVYEPPKRYVKPPEKRLSRTTSLFITGAGGDSRCRVCGTKIYEMEKIIADHVTYHRRCFKCSRCQRLLNLASYISIDGQPLCKTHLQEVVAQKELVTPSTNVKSISFDAASSADAKPVNIRAIKSSFEHQEVKVSAKKLVQPKDNSKLDDPVPSLLLTVDHTNTEQPAQHVSPLKSPKKVRFSEDLTNVEPIAMQNGFHEHDYEDHVFDEKRHQIEQHEFPKDGHIPPSSSATIPDFTEEIREEAIQISEAFAKFRQLERVEPPRGERKPVRKITPPREEPRYFVDKVESETPAHNEPEKLSLKVTEDAATCLVPEKNSQPISEIAISQPVYEIQKKFKTDDTKSSSLTASPNLAKNSIDEHTAPEVSGKLSNSDKGSTIVIEISTSTNVQFPEITETDGRLVEEPSVDEIPQPGFIKPMLTMWKSIEQQNWEREEKLKSSAKSPSAHPNLISSQSLKKTNDTTVTSTKTESKSPTDGVKPVVVSASGTVPPSNEDVAQSTSNQSIAKIKSPEQKPAKVKTKYVPALDFTRSRLAMFRELEAMHAQTSNDQAAPQRKSFKWSVHVNPLGRTTVLTPGAYPEHTTVTPQPSVHRNPTGPTSDNSNHIHDDQQDTSTLRKYDSSTTNYETSGEDGFYSSTDYMKNVLAQFRSMEDSSKPPPTPGLLGSGHQQKSSKKTINFNSSEINNNNYDIETMNYF